MADIICAEDLCDADVRLIDPFMNHPGVGDPLHRNCWDFGVFFLDGESLQLRVIRGGWDVYRLAALEELGRHEFRTPKIYREEKDVVQSMIDKFQPERLRISKRTFSKGARKLVRAWQLMRLERGVDSVEEYLALKEDSPDQSIPQDAAALEVFRLQEKISNIVHEYLHDAPALLGLPKGPCKIHREVRLDSRLSRAIRNRECYDSFCNDRDARFNSVTICDYVVEYSPQEIYIVESKTFIKEHQTLMRSKAQGQLSRAALFFQENFGVYPTLVRAEFLKEKVDSPEPKLSFVHHKFYEGRLHELLRSS